MNNETQVLTMQILDTILVDDTHYIDLVQTNLGLVTYLMHKTSEPNVFGVKKEMQGDCRSTINV